MMPRQVIEVLQEEGVPEKAPRLGFLAGQRSTERDVEGVAQQGVLPLSRASSRPPLACRSGQVSGTQAREEVALFLICLPAKSPRAHFRVCVPTALFSVRAWAPSRPGPGESLSGSNTVDRESRAQGVGFEVFRAHAAQGCLSGASRARAKGALGALEAAFSGSVGCLRESPSLQKLAPVAPVLIRLRPLSANLGTTFQATLRTSGAGAARWCRLQPASCPAPRHWAQSEEGPWRWNRRASSQSGSA